MENVQNNKSRLPREYCELRDQMKMYHIVAIT